MFIKSGYGVSVKENINLLERPVLEALVQQRLEQIFNPMDECYQTINCSSNLEHYFSLWAKQMDLYI